MTPEEIAAVADELDYSSDGSIVTFARAIAEHCALLADGMGDTAGREVAHVIRTAFQLGASS